MCISNYFRMDIDEGVQLLSKLSGLEEDKMTAAEGIVTLLNGIPLALTCAGHYMQTKALKNPEYSSSDFFNELKIWLQNFTKFSSKTHFSPTHVMVSMETKNLVRENYHLLHAFDFLGTCTPDWPIPISLIALHLRSPDFDLPLVVGSGPALPSQKPAEAKKEDNAGDEVEEMFLSIKKLAKNLESFMTAVKDNVDAIKAMLNPELPEMPQMVDGVVEMLRACPLVSVVRIEPMGKSNNLDWESLLQSPKFVTFSGSLTHIACSPVCSLACLLRKPSNCGIGSNSGIAALPTIV